MTDFDAAQFQAEYATPEGRQLWALLNRDDVAARMETASDLGQPALSAIEEILLAALGEVIMRDRYKQMAGRMTKQIMEARGYEHEAADIRMTSVPFYKASRYRRRNQIGLYLFRNSSDPRDICLTDDRRGAALPALPAGRWIYVNFLDSPLRAQFGFDLDLKIAIAGVALRGHHRHRYRRALRAG